ncbi:hypothetical protein [Natronococcus sp. JC468]|uniref:hypothetical protein n=1 Tax=Natronococcus sp. JC468 TaxID=1961921 RepID=UPI001FD8383A|nr:hypothetical protein [Natronococcus sp. JC468]
MVARFSRRSFLSAAGTGALSSLAGCMVLDGGASLGDAGPLGSASAGVVSGDLDRQVPTSIDPATYEDRFANMVVLTDEPYNADPTGEEPIDDALMMAWEDDTLIVLPKGQYKMNQQFRRTGWHDIGLIGQNAVIRHGEVTGIDGHQVTEGEYRGSTMLFKIGTAGHPHQGEFVFGGLIFDWARENAGMRGLYAMVGDRAEIRNIAFNGVHDLGTHGNMRVATVESDAFAVVDSIDMRGGGLHHVDTINTRSTNRADPSSEHEFGQSWSTTGLAGHPDAAGTTLYQNVICGPWPDNGLYVQGGGRQIVKDCVCSNSGTSNIRFNDTGNWEPVPEIDGDGVAYEQSTVEGCQVIIDRMPSGVHSAQRSIWHYDGPGAIRDCDVTVAYEDDASGAGGNYAIGTRSGVTESVIENCRINLLKPADAFYSGTSAPVTLRDIVIQTEGWDAGSEPTDVMSGNTPMLENVTLNGE